MKTCLVIPARLASSRLSEKLLRRVAGKSIVQYTYEAACRAKLADRVVVAVDDSRLADEVVRFGGEAVMTDPNHASGTDRIAEVAVDLSSYDLFINVQGDEPEIDAAAIDRVGQILIDDPAAAMSTIATPIRDARRLADPGVVKVVMAWDAVAGRGRAVYFSRAAVPHDRDQAVKLDDEPPAHWHHLGLYAYRREFLAWFTREPVGRLEAIEKLEQLRAIEAGKTIVVGRVERASPGIDTAEDLAAFAARMGHV